MEKQRRRTVAEMLSDAALPGYEPRNRKDKQRIRRYQEMQRAHMSTREG